MELNISPLDNRYKNKINELRDYMSDYGTCKIKTEVELKYLSFLMKKIFNKTDCDFSEIYYNFTINDMVKIKEFEQKTNHDVKALEYFIKDKLRSLNLIEEKYIEFVHFALTSQDINSMTNTLSLKRAIKQVIIPKLEKIQEILDVQSYMWKLHVMTAKTHGQPAVTTSMGKELNVFAERLKKQIKQLKQYKFSAKFSGAVGCLNAHYFCYNDIDWDKELNLFLQTEFNIMRNKFTTQIDHNDNLSELFDILKRINTIFIDLNQDIWLYISENYFKLKLVDSEIGSSTMPQKVNPINFENSEGNLYMANSLLNMFSQKLPISRLQRDLTDSTISRNFGSAISYCYLAYTSLETGLNKLEINNEKIDYDLNGNWGILMEAVQCVMKTEFKKNSYEIIKKLSRGKLITKEIYLNIVRELDISPSNKKKLLNLKPSLYIGNISVI